MELPASGRSIACSARCAPGSQCAAGPALRRLAIARRFPLGTGARSGQPLRAAASRRTAISRFAAPWREPAPGSRRSRRRSTAPFPLRPASIPARAEHLSHRPFQVSDSTIRRLHLAHWYPDMRSPDCGKSGPLRPGPCRIVNATLDFNRANTRSESNPCWCARFERSSGAHISACVIQNGVKMKALRHHADERVALMVELDLLPHHDPRRSAEDPLPQFVADGQDDDDPLLPGLKVARLKTSDPRIAPSDSPASETYPRSRAVPPIAPAIRAPSSSPTILPPPPPFRTTVPDSENRSCRRARSEPIPASAASPAFADRDTAADSAIPRRSPKKSPYSPRFRAPAPALRSA